MYLSAATKTQTKAYNMSEGQGKPSAFQDHLDTRLPDTKDVGDSIAKTKVGALFRLGSGAVLQRAHYDITHVLRR